MRFSNAPVLLWTTATIQIKVRMIFEWQKETQISLELPTEMKNPLASSIG